MVRDLSSTTPIKTQPSIIQFSKKELAIQKQKQISKIASLSILGALAATTCALAIALSVVFANPAFLVLFLATVLFSVVAAVTYLHITAKTSSDWKQSLTNYFNEIPPQVICRDFSTTQGDFKFYQTKANPKFKLGLQGDHKVAFSPVLLATPKGDKTPKKEGMIFNTIDPSTGKIATSTNLSTILFPTAMNNGDWHKCDTQDRTTKAVEPFSPTEARYTPYTKPQTAAANIKKEQIPSHLGHVRGPGVDEFPEQDEAAAEAYYLRALLSYESSLEAALEAGVQVVALPLFSSTYEVPMGDKKPQPQQDYVWPMECNLFCKKALIEATNNIARNNPKARLLVLLQDPFAPLAESPSDTPKTWDL